MGFAMVSGGKLDMAVPVAGILLSSIAEGSIVKLNENGSPVEFYVAKHDYESTLNGTGRTLLVRKDCYNTRIWNGSNVNSYANSNINYWLNNIYTKLLDEDAQSAIGTTKFYYTIGNGNTTVTTLEREIFLLSVTELGKTSSYANVEGSALPIASVLQIAYLNGSSVDQWTRTPQINVSHSYNADYLGTDGNVKVDNCAGNHGARPAFTLPSTSMFNKRTMLFKGVS